MKCILYIRMLMFVLVTAVCVSVHAQSDRDFIRSGNKQYRQQKFAAAETEYLKALNKNPRNTQALYNLGCALLKQQKDSAAIVQLENAGKMETAKKRKAMVFHNIGVIFQGHQMFAQAIDAYKESLRNNPSDNQTRYNLALCKRQLKNQKGGGSSQNEKKDQKQKQQQNKDKKDQREKRNHQRRQQEKTTERMSKDNAEQLLNAALQEEKETQQRMRQHQQSAQRRRLQKNW